MGVLRMNMFWVLPAIASPALYTIANFIDKILVDHHLPDVRTVTGVSGLASGVLGLVILLVCGGPWRLDSDTCYLLVGGGLLLLYLMPYFAALKKS